MGIPDELTHGNGTPARRVLGVSHHSSELVASVSRELRPTLDADRYDPPCGWTWWAQDGAGAPGAGNSRLRRLTIPSDCVFEWWWITLLVSFRWQYSGSLGLWPWVAETWSDPVMPPWALGPYNEWTPVRLREAVTNTAAAPLYCPVLPGGGRLVQQPSLKGPGELLIIDGGHNLNCVGGIHWRCLMNLPHRG